MIIASFDERIKREENVCLKSEFFRMYYYFAKRRNKRNERFLEILTWFRRSISHSSRGIFTRSRKLEWKMMEFNDGWKFEVLRFLTILSTVSSRCNKSSAVQSFLSVVYFRSIENCIWNARGTEKTSTKIYVNKRKLFNFNDNNLFNGNHSSDYSVFAFQLSVPLPSLPPRIRINLHSLDYHHGNHVPTTFNNE